MRKLICLVVALVMCMSIAAPAYATEDGFVPSITYKPNPEFVTIEDDEGNEAIGLIRDAEGETIGYLYHECLNVTPIAYVWDEEQEVPEEVEELLTFVYEALNADEMEIPYDKFGEELDVSNMVIRDLFDVRWECEEHRAMIEQEGVVVDITFDLGVMADVFVYVMTYDEETAEWSPIVKTVNNGDGTVTCTFEHFCAVSFSVPLTTAAAPVEEEATGTNVMPWIIVLAVAAVAAVAVVVSKKKKAAV